MVDKVFLTWAFAATGAPVPRTLPNRLADVINVLDYLPAGQPNGSADNSTDIQAAINAAFTTGGTPHGTNSVLNKEVFFPAGHYIANTPIALTQVQGGKITGAGKGSTLIENVGGGGNGAVFVTNGFKDSCIAHLELKSAAFATAPALDLNWDGSGVGLSGNTFFDLFITAGSGAAYGVRIARSNLGGGSDNVFLLPVISNFTTAAFETAGDEALNNVLIGGNLQGNATGILVTRGSVSTVDGVALEQQTSWDIEIKSTAGGGMSVLGMSSESPFFFKATTTYPVSIVGCSQRGTTPDTFAYFDGCPAVMEGCFAIAPSKVSCRNAARVGIVAFATDTTTSAWLDAPAATLALDTATPPGVIELENITYDRMHIAGGPFHTFKQRKTNHAGVILTQTYSVTP